jgi:hypothetical protein
MGQEFFLREKGLQQPIDMCLHPKDKIGNDVFPPELNTPPVLMNVQKQ